MLSQKTLQQVKKLLPSNTKDQDLNIELLDSKKFNSISYLMKQFSGKKTAVLITIE